MRDRIACPRPPSIQTPPTMYTPMNYTPIKLMSGSSPSPPPKLAQEQNLHSSEPTTKCDGALPQTKESSSHLPAWELWGSLHCMGTETKRPVTVGIDGTWYAGLKW